MWYRNGLCYDWASGSAAWFSHHVLDIMVVYVYKTVKIEAYLEDLKYVKVTLATIFGFLVISQREGN